MREQILFVSSDVHAKDFMDKLEEIGYECLLFKQVQWLEITKTLKTHKIHTVISDLRFSCKDLECMWMGAQVLDFVKGQFPFKSISLFLRTDTSLEEILQEIDLGFLEIKEEMLLAESIEEDVLKIRLIQSKKTQQEVAAKDYLNAIRTGQIQPDIIGYRA